ncbi:hypothetical protein, partial [Stenotrophomonas maltophilia]|uniref:hypothetical protein n=1 Tax=Stenotrophomonas maltophilia TaxID=40324 RepID=UPI001C65BE02
MVRLQRIRGHSDMRTILISSPHGKAQSSLVDTNSYVITFHVNFTDRVMRRHLLAAAILFAVQSAQAADEPT